MKYKLNPLKNNSGYIKIMRFLIINTKPKTLDLKNCKDIKKFGEDEGYYTSYDIANELNLKRSRVNDYLGKLVEEGLVISQTRVKRNQKKIFYRVSYDLKLSIEDLKLSDSELELKFNSLIKS